MKVISVENISKQYRLGLIGTGTLKDDLNRGWARLRGKEDPALKINEGAGEASVEKYVWALQNITFDVEEGEVLGIIGKNGAGKSTLLKILSKVTTPTTGQVKLRGRIASLLEVGTGFHPELTGRENIYLNGAILGMTRSEIRRKFDEIVSFSGVEKYIDTPVKRYSSGMYVRLAFAVAAHLEPEILIVDEVLAVGDAEFQKKCLGKMKDVSGQGRTVLFVSHNMTAIKSLCRQAVLLSQGQVYAMGDANAIVDEYLKLNTLPAKRSMLFSQPGTAPGNESIRIFKASVTPEKIGLLTDIEVHLGLWNLQDEPELKIAFDLYNINEQVVFGTATDLKIEKGKNASALCRIPGKLLNDDTYSIHLFVFTAGMRPLYQHKDLISFDVTDADRTYAYYGKVNGVIRPALNWEVDYQ